MYLKFIIFFNTGYNRQLDHESSLYGLPIDVDMVGLPQFELSGLWVGWLAYSHT